MIRSLKGITPQIDPTAWVDESALVAGDVQLAAHVSIWPASILRGDVGSIKIGIGTNIQDGTICHMTTNESKTDIGSRVTVGHRAILHGCTVEDDCLIGMGAIILDGAVIGRGSVIGAGALVTPNKAIPPHSVVFGSPGRVTRATNDRDRAQIDHSWREYVKTAQLWAGV